MFWRSVVGKLWFTILLLVSVVLLVLTVLLLEYFERFHTEQAEQELLNHANLIVEFLEESESGEEAVELTSTISSSYAAQAVVFGETDYWYTAQEESLPIALFSEDGTLARVLESDETVVTQGEFMNTPEDEREIMIVGVPFSFEDGEDGSLYLYQPLDVIDEASDQTKQIIFFSAAIAIILTTVFAFFLSSRITAPLRQMRTASLEVAKGNFDTKIPIQTKDEIGLLAMAFNRMGRALNTNLTALNREKEQLSRILASMADGVLTLNKEGQVVVMNPPAASFMETWKYEQQLAGDGQPIELYRLFRRVVTEEKEVDAEFTVQGRSWVILMTPLYDDDTIRGAVAVLRDMTEERQHDKLRKDFIANVSHELRTPISMLQGYSEAIVDDIAESAEEKKEMAGIIYDESLRIGRLVNELLDLARMEAGYLSLQREIVDIGVIVEKMIRKFQVVANEQQLSLSSSIKTSHAEAYADPDRIEQVLTNLIDNAVRHTSEKGSVSVSVFTEQRDIVIEVNDTGAGIPEEDLPFIFERFYKADKARTRGRAGTGLGLAIVKNIVDAHGGKVTARSKLNEGTTFRVELPSAKGGEEA
ncbi:ATP-binding protein [Alkalicoccus luteus]|uniref:histidine kinase n=1 Tax=Alkalicoccus luteus TaxID=1237094 RepID=A0A969TTY6_9BACI|nr:ATP-binding protein [Alkalicoccus luteus]NJP38153.1 cell wall metabolism sensor histidine kinase WalK [Alkalicoccus luteus]